MTYHDTTSSSYTNKHRQRHEHEFLERGFLIAGSIALYDWSSRCAAFRGWVYTSVCSAHHGFGILRWEERLDELLNLWRITNISSNPHPSHEMM